MRNTVAGESLRIRYDCDGQAVILHFDKNATMPSEVGNLVQSSYETVPSPYSIQNGGLVTKLVNTPIEVTV